MRRSPRLRRLESDWAALQQLRADSNLFDFSTPETPFAGPPEVYLVRFRGRGVWQPDQADRVLLREGHEVQIRLGAAYPRMIPELIWRTPIFHPNISGNGVVCLGGYSTHWAPSLQLDELCVLLWDIARYANYDVSSPYNRAAAHWARTETAFRFPLDARPLRDRITRLASTRGADAPRAAHDAAGSHGPDTNWAGMSVVTAELVFEDARISDAEIVDAEIVATERWNDQRTPVLYIG